MDGGGSRKSKPGRTATSAVGGMVGGSPDQGRVGRPGACRGRERKAKAPAKLGTVEDGDGRRRPRWRPMTDGGSPGRGRDGQPEARSVAGTVGLSRPGTDGNSPGRSWGWTSKSRPMPGSDGGSHGQNRRRPLTLSSDRSRTARATVDSGAGRREARSMAATVGGTQSKLGKDGQRPAGAGDERRKPRSKPGADGERPAKTGDGRQEARSSPLTAAAF